MRKLIRLIAGVYAIAMLAYGGWQIVTYYREAFISRTVNRELISQAVVERSLPVAEQAQTVAEQSRVVDAPLDLAASFRDDGDGSTIAKIAREQAPIAVDFDYLKGQSDEIVAWLYLEDSIINYPVAQAADNQYYLNHLPNGSWNSSGTLFVDCRNSSTFTDLNTVIYGHNMKNDTAFGTLDLYKEPEYYKEHPVMWLLTPDETYKLELIAGYVTSSDSQVYLQDLSPERQLEVMAEAMKNSTFDSGAELQPDDRFVSLSTCSYEYSDARYVLIGRLIALA